MTSVFTALQTVATLALAAGAEQFASKNYLVAIGCCVIGVACYVVYEILPPKPQ